MNNIEYEIKVLEIDVNNLREKLDKLGAKKEEKFFKIWSYKIDDENSKEEEHIRLRDEGNKITLAYKKKSGSGIDKTEEIEFEVSNFEKANQFLSKFRFNGIYYQERKRELYVLEDIEFAIDFWPKIPAFLEVESSSAEKVYKGLKFLNLEQKDEGNLSIVEVYKKYGLDIHSFKELKFEENRDG